MATQPHIAVEPGAEEAAERLDPREVVFHLSRIDILRALPPEEVEPLVEVVQPLYHPAGTQMITEGERGDAFYFIEEGTARVERVGSGKVWHVGAGSVVGETALLTGEPRSASVIAETDLKVWRVEKEAFDALVARSPNLRRALELLVEQRRRGVKLRLPSAQFWMATALRAVEARYRGLTGWQLFMGIGLALWVFLFANGRLHWLAPEAHEVLFAGLELVAGLLIIQGSCEAFIVGVERLGARLHWDGFISGTIGSVLSTLPEFVVIGFLVMVEPLAAFVTAVVTIFNNALVFSIYSFFLPKDRRGAFAMPRSVTVAGGEILIAGASITLIVGIVMLVVRVGGVKSALAGIDLLGIGAILMAIYGYYILTLMNYYGEGKDDVESVPADPDRLGHDTSWSGIIPMFALGMVGSYCGGESIGAFAEMALEGLGLPTIPTAAALAFFAGISEYIIVFKSHRRGELGIALSNVFGGLTQVMFLLLPFALVVIGIAGLVRGGSHFVVPINVATLLLMLLLFPLFYTLHQYVQQEKSLTNLDAAGMTGIYLLLLYFLFTSPA